MADSKGSSAKPSSGEKTTTYTQENTSRAKLLRMGQKSGLEPKGAPSTKP